MGEGKEELPAWPALGRVLRGNDPRKSYVRIEDYYRALSAAYEARLRLAVEALRGCVEHLEWSNAQHGKPAWDRAVAALDEIGDLPPSGERT